MDLLPQGMVQEKAPVLANRRIARDHYLMRLKSRPAAQRARPGQFVHVLCEAEAEGCIPLLRRPLSLFDTDPKRGTIDFIYKVVGLGTAALAQIRPGEKVDFLGPLGRPFEVPPRSQVVCLVGGGVGIPPLYFLAKRLVQKLKGSDPLQRGQTPVKVEVFLGARTKKWVICANDFRKLGVPVRIATDDGTLGYKGSVVGLLANVIARPPAWPAGRRRGRGDLIFKPEIASGASRPRNGMGLFICGPTPMMAAAARLAKQKGIPAQVSLEERMGCAMGCCMGCVVEVLTEPAGSHARYARICTEGPVFPAEAVAWR